MDTSTDDDEPLTIGSFQVAVYAAMLGATVTGQLVGMALDAAVLGRRLLWVPAACSVVLEALVGARLGAARAGAPLTKEQALRLSVYYSIGLGGVSLPLWGWFALSHAAPGAAAAAGGGVGMAGTVGVVLAALLVGTFVRFGLMVLVTAHASRSRSRKGSAVA